MKTKRKVEKGDAVVVVENRSFKQGGTVLEVHRHTIDVVFMGGEEGTYQRGTVYHHSDMDMAIRKFEKTRKPNNIMPLIRR